jgi:RHS repeat-associated protein
LLDSSGAVRARYDYDVWGNRTKLTGDLECEIGFTGYWSHAPSGLYLSPTRAYSSAFGRFISRDPLGEKGGLNLYGYVGNDPVNAVDPFGLEALLVIHRAPPQPGQIARDTPGIMTIYENGHYLGWTAVNENGYEEGTHGIYAGIYRVLPRTDADKKSQFPNGTPAVTALGEPNPGDAGYGNHYVYIHEKLSNGQPDSRGCITMDANEAERIKQLVFRNLDTGGTTLKIYFDKPSPTRQ